MTPTRLSSSAAFWLVAGLTIIVSQIIRQLLSNQAEINYDLAFSIALPSAAIFAITILFIGIIIWLFYAQSQLGIGWSVALGLIVGGGLSNLWDRIWLNGGVADYWQLWNLSTINLPDVLIVIGIIWAIKIILTSHAA